jgi:hypothetical protein
MFKSRIKEFGSDDTTIKKLGRKSSFEQSSLTEITGDEELLVRVFHNLVSITLPSTSGLARSLTVIQQQGTNEGSVCRCLKIIKTTLPLDVSASHSERTRKRPRRDRPSEPDTTTVALRCLPVSAAPYSSKLK